MQLAANALRLLRSPGTAVSAAGLFAALALCGGFGLVVQHVVRQGEASRRERALLHEATWRCQALKSGTLRATCLQRYAQQRPVDSARLQELVADSRAGTVDGSR